MATTTTTAGSGGSGRGGDAASSTNGVIAYLEGVRDELKKAIWPTRAEMVQLTKVVLAIIVAVACYCGILDAVLSFIVNKVLFHS